MHLGHNGQPCPVQRNPLDDVSMAGADEEESKRRIYLKMFLRVWAIKILLSLLTAMGFSITTSNGVLSQDLPTSHPTVQTWSSARSSSPRLLSHLMCLTIFTWMPWNARLLVCLSFFQKLRRFTIMQPQHPFLLVFITHQSLWSAY